MHCTNTRLGRLLLDWCGMRVVIGLRLLECDCAPAAYEVRRATASYMQGSSAMKYLTAAIFHPARQTTNHRALHRNTSSYSSACRFQLSTELGTSWAVSPTGSGMYAMDCLFTTTPIYTRRRRVLTSRLALSSTCVAASWE